MRGVRAGAAGAPRRPARLRRRGRGRAAGLRPPKWRPQVGGLAGRAPRAPGAPALAEPRPRGSAGLFRSVAPRVRSCSFVRSFALPRPFVRSSVRPPARREERSSPSPAPRAAACGSRHRRRCRAVLPRARGSGARGSRPLRSSVRPRKQRASPALDPAGPSPAFGAAALRPRVLPRVRASRPPREPVSSGGSASRGSARGGNPSGRGPPPSVSRPQVRRGDPLNLSILVSGGKETNEDSLSNGE